MIRDRKLGRRARQVVRRSGAQVGCVRRHAPERAGKYRGGAEQWVDSQCRSPSEGHVGVRIIVGILPLSAQTA
jgi:hypothetical protein